MSRSAPENNISVVSAPRSQWLGEVEAIDSEANTFRNTLVPIASLPPEVLGDIFEYLAYRMFSWSRRNTSYTPLASIRDWPNIMLVCKLWRDVAIHHHALWTYLDERNIQRWPLFLERSHSSLVDIRLYIDSEEVDGPLSAALAQLHRVRSLDLRLQENVMERVLPLLNIPAPTLQALNLSIAYGVTGHDGAVTPTRTGRWLSGLKKAFISELAPNVRQVSLFGVCFPWDGSANNIRHLTVDSGMPSAGPTMIPSTMPFSLSDILRSLSHSRLEILDIKDLSMLQFPDAEVQEPSFALTDLRVLKLSDVPAVLALPIWYSTANNCPSPSIVNIDINSLPDLFSLDQLKALIRHAASHMSRHLSNVERLVIHFLDYIEINSNDFEFFMPTPPFRLSRSAVTFELLKGTPLDHLTALELGTRVHFPREMLMYILPRMPLLVELHLSVKETTVVTLSGLLTMYRATSEEKNIVPDSDLEKIFRSPALPSLETLSLLHVDFTLEYKGHSIALYLKDMLRMRTQLEPRVGPTKVDIKDCDVTLEMIQSWSIDGMVAVAWDRRTGT
ncbi:hypothetical protein PENSPDRAFT_732121 [Peniophora sp. CONT]|nr:hypothetical protein PENSPDRAFT_732121 [Peniophora sp. CONT]